MAVEVTDQYGTVTEYVDLDAPASDRLGALADGLTGNVAALLGCTQAYARQAVLCELVRLTADAKAYEREAGRRGVLPL